MRSNIITDSLIENALIEDLGHGFDITTDLTVPADAIGTASFVSREGGVLAGIDVALRVFDLFEPGAFDIQKHKEDGAALVPGDIIATIKGPVRGILTAERTALNFLTHMCGIATLTARFVEQVRHTNAKICDTRKTLPGLRAVQKYAVTCGGGMNHRFGLDDAIMIKDNHIALGGGLQAVLDRARAKAGHTRKIEVEVDTLDQLQAVLDHGGADIVLLDNMGPDVLKQAVSMVDGRLMTEASGGVSLEAVKAIAETGVDYISVGALTHSVMNFDVGLDVLVS